MYDYSIAMLPITVRVDTDQKYQRYEVLGMKLNFIPAKGIEYDKDKIKKM